MENQSAATVPKRDSTIQTSSREPVSEDLKDKTNCVEFPKLRKKNDTTGFLHKTFLWIQKKLHVIQPPVMSVRGWVA